MRKKTAIFNSSPKIKKFLKAKPLTAAQYNLFSHWYYVAILEMIRIDTPEIKNLLWLKNNLNPPVSPKLIKRAVAELKVLDLLEEKKNGDLMRRDAMLATEDKGSLRCRRQFSRSNEQDGGPGRDERKRLGPRIFRVDDRRRQKDLSKG